MNREKNMKKSILFRADTGKKIICSTLFLIGIFSAASAVGYLFCRIGFDETNIVLVYLLAVLAIAWFTHSFVFGVLSSFLATFLFGYIFVQPEFTFLVDDADNYIVTFVIMTLTALITSALTSHARQSVCVARLKEAQTKAIYALTNRLTGAKNMDDIASAAVAGISTCFSCQAACLCFDSTGMPGRIFVQQVSPDLQVHRKLEENQQEYKRMLETAASNCLQGREFYDWPILGKETILGVIRIPSAAAQAMDGTGKHLLRAMVEGTALAMDRHWSSRKQMQFREETVKERYRSNLLRAISHDLRTPLAGIIGSCEMLLDMTDAGSPQYAIAADMHKEAIWLHSLVENILSLTRLQDGSLSLSKQVEAVEEIVAGAVRRMAKRTPECIIHVNIPEKLILVPMDARLIEQVLINLLSNAVLHANVKDPVDIIVSENAAEKTVRFIVQDRGVGIVEEDLPHIFEMFYTRGRGHADAGQGIGLGLAICETIVQAHGGSISAENREDGPGARFIFTLPTEA